MVHIVQRQMIFWTLALVLFVGAVCIASILTPPVSPAASGRAEKKTRARTPATTTATTTTTTADTALALPQETPGIITELDEKKLAQAITLTIPCSGDQKVSLGPQITQIRLNGQLCNIPTKGKLGSSTIVNNSNGASATVFFPGGQAFTTDYFSLAPGANSLQIRHVYENGSAEERILSIERQ